MTRYNINYEAGTDGVVPVVGASEPLESGHGIDAPGTVTYSNTHVAHGTMATKHSPASSGISRITYGNSSNRNFNSTALAVRAYLYFTVVPTGLSSRFLTYYDNTDQVAAAVRINTSGYLDIQGNTTTSLATGTVAIPADKWVRLEIYATAGTGNATITAAAYEADSTTPIDMVTVGTATTAATLSSVWVGKNNYNAYATPYWVDSVAIETTATGLIGPVQVPLATPTPVVVSSTNPTSPVAIDGTATITWAVIPNAVRYEVAVDPDGPGHTVKSTSATSPYTVTGLPAGTTNIGVRAHPE